MKKCLEKIYSDGHYYLYRGLEEIENEDGGGINTSWGAIPTSNNDDDEDEESYLIENGISIKKSEILNLLFDGYNKLTKQETNGSVNGIEIMKWNDIPNFPYIKLKHGYVYRTYGDKDNILEEIIVEKGTICKIIKIGYDDDSYDIIVEPNDGTPIRIDCFRDSIEYVSNDELMVEML